MSEKHANVAARTADRLIIIRRRLDVDIWSEDTTAGLDLVDVAAASAVAVIAAESITGTALPVGGGSRETSFPMPQQCRVPSVSRRCARKVANSPPPS